VSLDFPGAELGVAVKFGGAGCAAEVCGVFAKDGNDLFFGHEGALGGWRFGIAKKKPPDGWLLRFLGLGFRLRRLRAISAIPASPVLACRGRITAIHRHTYILEGESTGYADGVLADALKVAGVLASQHGRRSPAIGLPPELARVGRISSKDNFAICLPFLSSTLGPPRGLHLVVLSHSRGSPDGPSFRATLHKKSCQFCLQKYFTHCIVT